MQPGFFLRFGAYFAAFLRRRRFGAAFAAAFLRRRFGAALAAAFLRRFATWFPFRMVRSVTEPVQGKS